MSSSERSESHQPKIQQLKTGSNSVDIKSKVKKASNWISKNPFFVELDFFYANIKFMVNGDDSFTTIFGGLVSLIIIAGVALITYYIAWPGELTSRIVFEEAIKNVEPTSIDFCTRGKYPIEIGFIPIDEFLPNVTVIDFPPQFQLKGYYNSSNGSVSQIPISTNCSEGKHFCLNCYQLSHEEKIYEIYGGNQEDDPAAQIFFELNWCRSRRFEIIENFTCNLIDYYLLNISVEGFWQQKEMSYKQYQTFNLYNYHDYSGLTFGKAKYLVTREKYESNNKFFGHLGNILSQSSESFYIEPPLTIQQVKVEDYQQEELGKQKDLDDLQLFISFQVSGVVREYRQEFSDVTEILVFFIALLEPVALVLAFLLISPYNENAKHLSIANKLYYVEDPTNDEKYDFDSGPSVFLACLIHKHILTKIFGQLIGLCGYNIFDFLPSKSINAFAMMNEGERLMKQQQFYKYIETIIAFDNTQTQKVKLVLEQEEDEEQPEQQYFPNNSIQREAFRRFCKDNEIYSGRRKNKVYRSLLNKRCLKKLKSKFHEAFETYVRNVQKLAKKGKYLETFHDDEIPVDFNKIEETGMQLRASHLKSSQGPIMTG